MTKELDVEDPVLRMLNPLVNEIFRSRKKKHTRDRSCEVIFYMSWEEVHTLVNLFGKVLNDAESLLY